jgi:hypothetical protein
MDLVCIGIGRDDLELNERRGNGIYIFGAVRHLSRSPATSPMLTSTRTFLNSSGTIRSRVSCINKTESVSSKNRARGSEWLEGAASLHLLNSLTPALKAVSPGDLAL